MHVHRPRRGIRLLTPVLWLAVSLALSSGVPAAFAAAGSSTQLAGTWSGKYSGAFAGTFTLHWKQSGSRLTGTIVLSSPHGTYAINGSVRGSAIEFGAVGAGATYTGSVSGKSMSGSYKSPQGGGKWRAHRIS